MRMHDLFYGDFQVLVKVIDARLHKIWNMIGLYEFELYGACENVIKSTLCL